MNFLLKNRQNYAVSDCFVTKRPLFSYFFVIFKFFVNKPLKSVFLHIKVSEKCFSGIIRLSRSNYSS